MPESVTRDNIEECFTYQPPDKEQTAAFDLLRDELTEAGKSILDYCPESPDRDRAMDHLRAARMWANSAIAHRGRF